MPQQPTSSPAPPGEDRLRVAFDVGPLYGHQTGIGRAVEQISLGLAATDTVALRPYLISGRARPSHNHHRLPLPGLVASQLWSRVSIPRADRWLGHADVVHGTNYVAPPTRIPTVVSVYDCWFLEHPELAGSTVARAGRWLQRSVDRGAWVHCSSAATAQRAAELLGTDRTRTIYLGPPKSFPEPVAPLPTADPFDIVAIGTEERRKGYPDLVRAFGTVAQQHRDVRLAIAGAPGDDSEQISVAIERLPSDTRQRLARLGPIDDAHKTRLLQGASLLAYPSLDEGFGFPLLEANQAGVPIVARAAGSIPEVAANSAVLVQGGDGFVERLADAMSSVLSDVAVRERLISAGRENLLRFSWRQCVEQLVDLYRTAAGDHNINGSNINGSNINGSSVDDVNTSTNNKNTGTGTGGGLT